MSGKDYADLVASYVLRNFGSRGLTVYREVSMGKTIIGKNRHVDILVLREQSAGVLAIECKFQETLGTVDEKIPYAINDLQAMGVPVCLAYAGSGFSAGILHMLAACPIAAQCLPTSTLAPSRETRELDIAVAMAFRFWDLVVLHKRPFVLSEPTPADPSGTGLHSPPSAPQVAAAASAPPSAELAPKSAALSAEPLFARRREPEPTEN